MKNWSVRQLRSYLDAHQIEYQPPYPPLLKERHYQKYLLKVLARAGVYRPDQACSMREIKPSGYIPPMIVTIICPICMKPFRAGCDCQEGDQYHDE